MKTALDILPLWFLRECFRYEVESGKLYWLVRPRDHFGNDGIWKAMNTKFTNTALGCSVRGYRAGAVTYDGESYPLVVHRICYALYHGKYPDGHIGHFSQRKDDNRISNLRDVTHQENMRNKKVYENNRTGVAGVNYVTIKGIGYWTAKIGFNGDRLIEYCKTKELALAIRKDWEEVLGYQPQPALQGA